MRAIALSILLAASIVDRAIKRQTVADLPKEEQRVEMIVGLAFLICLVFGW